MIGSEQPSGVVSQMPVVILCLHSDRSAVRCTTGEGQMGGVRATEHSHHGGCAGTWSTPSLLRV